MNETLKKSVSNANETLAPQSETFFNSLVGIGEAAHITGRSKGQIGRDANTKRLPFVLDEKNQKRYRVSDLSMIYGLKNPDETKKETPKETVSQEALRPTETATETAIELALLRQQVQHQNETIRRVEDENRDLKRLRDTLIDQTQRLTLLLPAPAAEPSTIPEPKPEAQPLTFWERLFSPRK
jgi:hypothetical protein